MNQERIGKYIQEKRKEKNLTQQELGYIIGVTDRAISKWENGRGLPDLSLLKPLCDALDISLNSLLSGEDIKEKEIEKKSEENIIKTIDYSKKKIKKTISITTIIITLLVSIISIVSILYLIDLNRMRNNEEILFSTWGFDYPIKAEEDSTRIENTIEKYIENKNDKERESNLKTEKNFALVKSYLITKDSKKYYAYTWILEETFIKKEDLIEVDSSSSMPYKITLKKDNNKYEIINIEHPRDGIFYVKDLEILFPKSVIKKFSTIHNDGTISRLEDINYEKALKYFNIKE